MSHVADSEMSLGRLDRRLYALCAAPYIADEAIDAVQQELADLRANMARLRRTLQQLRNET